MRNSDQYTVYLGQGGLGLPDRDYYLETDNDRFQNILQAYPGYIVTLFELAGIGDGENKANAIVALETQLAQYH